MQAASIITQLTGTSTDADALIIISRTSVDHRILIKFRKPIIDCKKNVNLTSLVTVMRFTSEDRRLIKLL